MLAARSWDPPAGEAANAVEMAEEATEAAAVASAATEDISPMTTPVVVVDVPAFGYERS